MSKVIQLDFVSDVVCPWCVIGYKRLEQAISELGIEQQIELRFHPFELNPDMPEEGENLREHLAKKYGTTLEDSIRARENLTQLGAEVGFTFDYFDEMKMLNTRKAHLLLQFAAEYGKQKPLKLAFFDAFFGQRQDISDPAVLEGLVAEVGLPVSKVMAVLNDSQALAQLESEEEAIQYAGIQAVPALIINNREAMVGAQPVEAYKEFLESYL